MIKTQRHQLEREKCWHWLQNNRLCEARQWVGDFDYVARNSNHMENKKNINKTHIPKKREREKEKKINIKKKKSTKRKICKWKLITKNLLSTHANFISVECCCMVWAQNLAQSFDLICFSMVNLLLEWK